MAMVADARRAPAARAGRGVPSRSAGGADEQLAARLHEIGRSATSPEDALEPMLQAVLESTGAAAGALCLYDVHQQVLRLAAEVGLSDDGCRQLRTVRRGDADSWGMPLHGMLNRRCYLIENAAQNRFVPPLVEDAAKVETVACLPLYSGETPLASLILITRTPRTLGERELQAVGAPTREIGQLIETMRQRTMGRESRPQTVAPVPRVAPDDTARLTAELAGVERERDQLAAELDRLRARLGEAEADAARERRAREELEARVVGEADARVTQLLTEIDQVRARLAEAEAGAAHEQRAREELETRLAGGVSAGQQELRKALEAAREAERARAAAVAEAAHLRTELEHVRQGASAQTSDVSARLVEAEAQLEALREQHTTEVGSLSARLETLAAEADRLREAEATISSERDRLAADLEGTAAARAHLEEVLKEALEEARAKLGATREEHAAEIASLGARLETLSAEADELRAAQAAVGTERDHLAADLADAHAAQARLEETLQQALEDSRAREEALEARLAERDRELESLRSEHAAAAAELNAQLETLAAESEQLQHPEPAPSPPTAPPAPEQIADADARPKTPSTKPAAKDVPRAPARPTRPAAPSPSSGAPMLDQRLVAVLDGDPVWQGVSLDRHEVILLAPDGDVVARLEETRPGRVVGNLAVPEVLRALVSIREARVPMRLWGCIADGAGDRALPLGLIEPAARPLAPDTVVASLSSYAAHGARVVTVGADTDALLSLRQALTRQGMSVSMAWDEKQAAEMVDMVRPGIVVVDLSMQRDACAFVARLAGTSPVPTVVLIEGADDPAASFAAALDDRTLASQMTSLKSLLAAAVGRGEGRQSRAGR